MEKRQGKEKKTEKTTINEKHMILCKYNKINIYQLRLYKTSLILVMILGATLP